MKQLLCVRHQMTCPLGVVADELDSQQVEWRYLDLWRDTDVPELSEISGLIVLGGEMNVDELDRYPFLKTGRDLTRDAIEAELPVLGICLGAQVMTRALGASVQPSPHREIGFVQVHATHPGLSDPVLAPFAPAARVFQFHEDVCELPEGAELLFRGDTVTVQAFKVGDHAYGVQFHFEVTMAEIEAWCEATPNLKDEWGLTKQEVVREAENHLAQQQKAGRSAARGFIEILKDRSSV